ncbi:Extracellular ribonuclease precursor [Maioricimonas rarisocia]|uniref:Extracellular ribonuclease n=1 Tax=Maioricimonas rarisocia TaxID=2528026 RepID=A0A517Z4Y7_9PLAN|nr:endonuclease [Maioricimonas rarisocia]QDU37561.1 Extracellular ribonuclease precursor [Maioricimonas rarisocia]
MPPMKELLARLEETERRFKDRKDTRESATRSLSEKDFVGANSNEALRARLSHLNAAPDLTERVGTRSFRMPQRPIEGGTREIIDNVTLERILAENDLMPVSYLALGMQKARSVGRIHVKDTSGRRLGFGTGFLVSPTLLLTNNHVLESENDAVGSEVEFDFEVDLAGNVRQTVLFKLAPQTFFLTDRDLDFTLVAVSPASGREAREWGWIHMVDEDGLIVTGEYVSIIQHPNGEAKQLALRENEVVDLLDDFAHYRTDTAPGSSGSPVFNDQWELVALHHSGVPERDRDGNILAVDGRKWEPWMGDHRIKWIANEGVSGKKIVDFIKRVSDLTADQKRLRDQLFDGPPPVEQTPAGGHPLPRQIDADGRGERPTPPSTGMPNESGGMTWTIPLQVTVNLGMPQAGRLAPSPPVVAPPPDTDSGVGTDADTADAADLQQALAEAENARTRTYFDAEQDEEDRDTYYSDIDAGDLSRKELFRTLHDLLKATHTEQPRYKPSLHVYPWVDLHPDRKLRSIYSGQSFEPEEFIREDFRIEQERTLQLQELMRQESGLSPERLQEEIDLLEAQNPFNCEHVVPQSWYAKKEPMRGDLHHLFACESGCNSFRSNIPYFDFSDFEEVVRTECGKREQNRFEPSAGKGTVARATLYFLLRYPGKVSDPEEFPADRISMLLQWHADHPVTEYERHRNQAIFAKQGNRNPLIDFPDWAGEIAFARGLD